MTHGYRPSSGGRDPDGPPSNPPNQGSSGRRLRTERPCPFIDPAPMHSLSSGPEPRLGLFRLCRSPGCLRPRTFESPYCEMHTKPMFPDDLDHPKRS